MSQERVIKCRAFDETAAGERASLARTPTKRDIQNFALLPGDVTPTHRDADHTATDLFRRGEARAAFLVGDAAKQITGTIIPVDSGQQLFA
ncbi:hypothetical protein [Sphingobium aquiterrae]|uniref:hypothetical protein n=1 Tax=Sphingobium aquiterrae TaxID=2038656 RepID=UPI003017D692|tara:strand:- start:858 stop:1130 length:273 start_codon:yes stop_codon:yes gene_type:complete